MATPASYLDNVIADQESRKPPQIDQERLANRFLFVPFLDRELTMELTQSLGLPELKAGCLLPLTRFRQPIVDNTAVQRVPVGYDGKFVPVAPGIEEFTLKERVPAVVFDAIMRIFNPYAGVDPQQDNGICEVEALRGSTDFDLLKAIQRKLLPENYSKARAQLVQLAGIILGNPPAPPVTVDDVMALGTQVRGTRAKNIYQTVAHRLYASTETSFTWARWQYHNLQSQMENRQRTGKDRLSPLDAAVCEWIEMPEPRYQSQLASSPQVVIQQAAQPAAASAPTIWCSNCGSTTNLGPQGQAPKACPGCHEPFAVEAGKADEATDLIEPAQE